MKRREIQIPGTVNNNGGLALYMGELNEFLKGWKGSKVIVTVSVLPPRASEALRGYYFNYVVPTFRQAIEEAGERLTCQQAEEKLREWSPIMRREKVNPDTGKYTYELREVYALSNAELIEHIETLKQLAAEEFNLFIDDPNNYAH